MNRHAMVVAMFAISVFCALIGTAEESDASRLVGTWRLVEYTDFRAGKTIHAFGAEPLGLFIYALEMTSDQQDQWGGLSAMPVS